MSNREIESRTSILCGLAIIAAIGYLFLKMAEIFDIRY